MEQFEFQKARPIWAAGRTDEKNCELAFRCLVPAGAWNLYLASSGLYRVWINGQFVAAGPARSAHGYYPVDCLPLAQYCRDQSNVLVVEVLGNCVATYDTLKAPHFLQAELTLHGTAVAYTSDERWQCFCLGQRIQRVQRYSFQRAFPEAYRLQAALQPFYRDAAWTMPGLEQVRLPSPVWCRRTVPMPCYEVVRAVIRAVGTADLAATAGTLPEQPATWETLPTVEGFPFGPETLRLSQEGREALAACERPGSDRWSLYTFPYDATGFLRLRLSCGGAARIYVLFDECLTEGDVDIGRLQCCNVFRYDLDAGSHTVQTFAPFTMGAVKLVLRGPVAVEAVELVTYQHPPLERTVALPEDGQLREICRAALRTFRSNAVDLFTDCPSRERAGWLCDSFFIGRTEYALTGENRMERAFLENFLLPDHFDHLPEGMLPMCYPADHPDGNFIPNWAMWYVLELEAYTARTGDGTLAQAARDRVLALVRYFAPFENRLGLLENLAGWVFLEWSRANDPDVVAGVNFPTNMLYMRMLQAVASLYHLPELEARAAALRRTIRARSFDGRYFTDNEIPDGDGWRNPGNRTEVCQYYAFFSGTATPEEDDALFRTMVSDYGPGQRDRSAPAALAPANAFIGYYLRLELLYQTGRRHQLISELKGYFLPMAERTGTLWEFRAPQASCCHGFASNVLYWLAAIYGTEAMPASRQTLHT